MLLTIGTTILSFIVGGFAGSFAKESYDKIKSKKSGNNIRQLVKIIAASVSSREDGWKRHILKEKDYDKKYTMWYNETLDTGFSLDFRNPSICDNHIHLNDDEIKLLQEAVDLYEITAIQERRVKLLDSAIDGTTK